MKTLSWVAVLLFGLGSVPCTAINKGAVYSIDALFHWSSLFSLSPEQVTGFGDKLSSASNEASLFVSKQTSEQNLITFGRDDPYQDQFSFLSGKFRARKAYFVFRDGKSYSMSLTFKKADHSGNTADALASEAARLTSSVAKEIKNKSPRITRHREWKGMGMSVNLYEYADEYFFAFTPLADGPPASKSQENEPRAPLLTADLDALLNFPALWNWSSEDFEKNYVRKLQDQESQQKPPQFEWVSNVRDRARFSRHMFSNAETKLTMFGGSIKLEEAILEFVSGKAARATISFYNRGDSGDIEVKEFDRIFKVVGQNLTQVMKVAPKRQILSSNAALPVTGWLWTSPTGIALLEYNEYNTPGKVTRPEFLRLKLAAPNQADWSMGKLAVGVQRMELAQRVTKKPDGDVYITGVPMVDQGQKGYCVAASCQRLFEYMRIPCDQHEMAKLVGVDAEGADIFVMQKSLAKIDGAFNVTFKPLINPELYYASRGNRRVSEKAFLSLIKEYADKGVPLLWGLMLGQKPEIPPLPGDGQISGGHMRMIIGYNLAKNQVLFTDSWGAGHELKRMAVLDAYDVTQGLYSMAPRGF